MNPFLLSGDPLKQFSRTEQPAGRTYPYVKQVMSGLG